MSLLYICVVVVDTIIMIIMTSASRPIVQISLHIPKIISVMNYISLFFLVKLILYYNRIILYKYKGIGKIIFTIIYRHTDRYFIDIKKSHYRLICHKKMIEYILHLKIC